MSHPPPPRNSVIYLRNRTYSSADKGNHGFSVAGSPHRFRCLLAAEDPRVQQLANSAQPTIYVVDDDDAVRDSLKILLESYDLAVRDFGSVPDFLAELEPSRAACLVDLHLPVMGGFDIMNTLAQRGSRLPVIVITGRGDDQTKARALEAGAVAFLEKPVDDESLMTAIHSARRTEPHGGEPLPPARKLLYRRGGASHNLGHTLSHTLSHATYPSFVPSPDPIVPPMRAGHRRRFSEADRRHILAEAAKPGASLSEVASMLRCGMLAIDGLKNRGSRLCVGAGLV
jgi:two-component system response regulator FixJ